MSRRKDEDTPHSMLVGITGALGLLVGLLPLPLNNPIIIMLVAGAGVAGILGIVEARQRGRSWLRAIVGTLLVAGLGFGVAYGIMWYFTKYLPSTGQPLIQLEGIGGE